MLIETIASGTCGDGLTWKFTSEDELIIEGTGNMDDVELVFEDRTIRFNDVHGYYMHKKNVFSLLVQEGELIPENVIEEG